MLILHMQLLLNILVFQVCSTTIKKKKKKDGGDIPLEFTLAEREKSYDTVYVCV